jgi:serine/threonine-protein kinase
MAEQNAKSFLSLLEKSRIVADDSLKSALSKLADIADGEKVNTEKLASHLVDSGLITRWHVDKLLDGKYKGFFLGKFKLLGHLGTGGMSSVYLAQHKVSEQTRAIKVLPRKRVSDKSYLERFYREGQAAAALNHPNVVRIYDICSEADTHFMVMEHVKGADLYEIVKDDGPLSPQVAADYVLQAAEGLKHAHEKAMVHRDIKPANLLRTQEGVVKILDLGLALFQQEEEESLTVLHNEKVMGTADYLAPEQAVNSHNVDHRADIYSLGCTLYFLLTGKPPFSEGSLAQRIAMHQTQEPLSLLEADPNLPPELVKICEKMMRKNPDDRYRDCDHLRQAIAGFLARQTTSVAAGGDQAFQDSTSSTSTADATNRVGLDDSATSKTDELAVATVAHSRDAAADSPFAIDTSSVAQDPNASPSSRAIARASSATDKTTKVAPKIRTRRRGKKVPAWAIAAVVIAMIAILVGVLIFAASIA